MAEQDPPEPDAPAPKRRRRRRAAEDAPANGGEKRQPTYTVIRVEDDDTFTVVRGRVTAKNQLAAADLVVEEQPEDQRAGTFGAFLADSLKLKKYNTETRVETTSEAVEVSW